MAPLKADAPGVHVFFDDLLPWPEGEFPAEPSPEVCVLHDGDRGVGRPERNDAPLRHGSPGYDAEDSNGEDGHPQDGAQNIEPAFFVNAAALSQRIGRACRRLSPDESGSLPNVIPVIRFSTGPCVKLLRDNCDLNEIVVHGGAAPSYR